MKPVLQRIWAVSWLTVQAAVRFRVVLFLTLALLVAVGVLPALIRHNGTAQMFAQVLVTYSLYLITGLLSLSSLWLACGLHATDVDTGPLQLLAVKPAARWQIWVGRWIGIVAVQSGVLLVAGAFACVMLFWQARRLDPDQQQILAQEVLVSRGSLREAPPNLDADVERMMAQRQQDGTLEGLDPSMVRRELRDQMKARHEVIGPNFRRLWDVDFGGRRAKLVGKVLHVRVFFHASQATRDALINTVWLIGDPTTGRFSKETRQLGPGVAHEFRVSADLIDGKGRLHIECENRDTQTMLFPLETGMEVLYQDGSFVVNYIRAILVIGCWLALLTAIGLFAATFLSFTVAALLAMTLLGIAASGDTFAEVVRNGTVLGRDHETGMPVTTPVNALAMPIYRVLDLVLSPLETASPVAALSEGRSISWREVLKSIGGMVVLLGGGVAGFGILIFQRRELAKASS
jgi:ABC-type transport system involved in multi-copper enzyme maturation permease subunit